MKLYFWVKLSRVTGKVGMLKSGKPWRPSSTADNCDAKTTGLFDDSITFVDFATVGPCHCDQCISIESKMFRLAQIQRGESMGFHNCMIVAITEKEYAHWTRQLSEVKPCSN